MQLAPMLLGTVTGMTVWSILYASLGGASRSLLEGGADLEVLLEGEGPIYCKTGLLLWNEFCMPCRGLLVQQLPQHSRCLRAC